MSEIEAIVQATHVLSRVSAVNIQDLVPYQTKLEDTLCILQRSLEAIRHQSSQVTGSSASSPLPNTPISSSEPPFSRDCARSSISQQSTSSADDISNSVSGESENLGSEARELLQALADSKRSKKIVDYLSSSASDPVNGSRDDWTQEDPRVVDIVLCSGTRSLDASFRRGLGQRSLAMEYEKWEETTFKTSRVSELHRDPSAAEDHNGHINQFIEANSLRFKDKNTTLHGIKHGIRLLVFERTYEHVGVSAILILVYSRFRKVKYKHHYLLKQLLQGFPLWDSLARNKSSWLVQCQGRYDERIAIWQELQELRSSWQPTCEGRKRQRLIDGHLRSFRSPLNASAVLPTDILVNNGEQPHDHSAPNAGHSTMETTLRIERDTAAATHPPPECLASLDNVSLPQNLDHQSLVEESSTPPRLMDGVLPQALLPDQQSATQRPGIATGRFLEETDVPSSPNNQQLSHSNPSNAGPTYVFNPLDYPNLLPGTQLPQDSQIPNVFNPLDYPCLVTDPRLPPESQLPTVFNPLDYPSLVPDPQIPESQISDVFDPNRIPSHQLHPVLQFLNVFNPLDYPSIPSDAQTCANIRQAENAQSDIPPTILPAF